MGSCSIKGFDPFSLDPFSLEYNRPCISFTGKTENIKNEA